MESISLLIAYNLDLVVSNTNNTLDSTFRGVFNYLASFQNETALINFGDSSSQLSINLIGGNSLHRKIRRLKYFNENKFFFKPFNHIHYQKVYPLSPLIQEQLNFYY